MDSADETTDFLDTRMAEELAHARREGTAVSFILCNIDQLEDVSERWGHRACDAVLERVAAALRSAARAEDVCARAGADKLAILAGGLDRRGARVMIDRLCRQVAQTPITWHGVPLAVTISVGIATHGDGDTYRDARGLLAEADEALRSASRAPALSPQLLALAPSPTTVDLSALSR